MVFKYPPRWQQKKILRQTCKLIKVTDQEIEDEYGQSVESQTLYEIPNCEIQPITSEDLQFMPPGVLEVGDARAFFPALAAETICMHEFINPPLYTYDDTKIEVANGLCQLIREGAGASPVYPVDNPSITPKFSCKYESSPHHIVIKEYKPSKTDIRYLISKDAGIIWYYWDGANWSISDETYAQTMNSTALIDHFTSFPSSPGNFSWKIFLHSDNGTQTPQVELIKGVFGIEVEINDYIVDQENIKYRVERIVNYYEPGKIFMKEVYLKRVVGE